jgi:hypothetical protein
MYFQCMMLETNISFVRKFCHYQQIYVEATHTCVAP